MSEEINDNSITLQYNVPHAMIDENMKRLRSPAGNGQKKYSSVFYRLRFESGFVASSKYNPTHRISVRILKYRCVESA